MNELLVIFKGISLNEIIKQEELDSQYISLKNLYFNIKNKDFYLSLIISNSIICYQLSSSGEEYWQEFSNYFSIYTINNLDDLIIGLIYFIKDSKGNKRFTNIKIKRLEKLKYFLSDFILKQDFYYKNMEILQKDLANIMKQKIGDKTIVFAIKMFGYSARNYFHTIIYFPVSIPIPIDSRLTKLYEIYNKDLDLEIKDFYKKLAKKLKIPELHLDVILWVNYYKLIENHKKPNIFCKK